MTEPTEAEIDAAAEVAFLRNRAGSTSWRDLPENHRRVWREKVTPILTAAAQVRERAKPRQDLVNHDVYQALSNITVGGQLITDDMVAEIWRELKARGLEITAQPALMPIYSATEDQGPDVPGKPKWEG